MAETGAEQGQAAQNATGVVPVGIRRTVAIAGTLLALPGLLVAFAYCCSGLLLLTDGGSPDGFGVEIVVFFSMLLLTLGAGGVAAWHGLRSLRDVASKPMRLPPIWVAVSLLPLLIVVGLVVYDSPNALVLLFPLILWIGAALPPLSSVSWFMRSGQTGHDLTWRRGMVAFVGGATGGALIALVLEVLFPAVVLLLVLNLADSAIAAVETLFAALAGQDVAAAVTSSGFLYAMIQLAIVAPLAEEFAKPVITLPVLKRLTRRGAFLVGAMAGAGFATLENVLYAGLGGEFWAGILVVRALCGAIHPFCAGLVALGWHDMLNGRPYTWLKTLIRFGAAVGLHALWNGGTVLVLTLAGAQFFGELPPEIDILGLSAAGTTLALLIVLGLFALWAGRWVLGRLGAPGQEDTPAKDRLVLGNRSIAIWALLCLAAFVPAGIVGLQLLFH